jgi:transposase
MAGRHFVLGSAVGDEARVHQEGGVRRIGLQRPGGRLSGEPILAGPPAPPGLVSCRHRAGLAHPLGVKGFAYRRVKNDVRDAADLADLLRMGRLPEGWIAPPAVRELRELVRHRAKLVAWRSGLKASVHAVLAKQGLHVAMSDVFGVGGRQLLARVPLDAPYRLRVNALCRLTDALDFEIQAVGGPLRVA